MDPTPESPLPALSITSLESTRQTRAIPGGIKWLFYALGLLVSAALILGSIVYSLHEAYHDTLAYWAVRISSSADERARFANLWLRERQTDTIALAHSRAATRLLSPDASDRGLGDRRLGMESTIDDMARLNGFLGGVLADADCRIVAEAGLTTEEAASVQQSCQMAQSAKDFEATVSVAKPSRVLLCLAYPVLAPGRGSLPGDVPNRALGAMVMITEPWKSVFPFLAGRSNPKSVTDTLVVWQEADTTVIFSPRLAIRGEPSVFRKPRRDVTLESVAGLQDKVAFGEFTDFRGVRVFGAAEPIESTRASLVRQVNRDGALAEFHKQAWLESLAGTLLFLLFGAVTVISHRHIAAREAEEMLRHQQAVLELRRRAEEALRQSDQRYKDFISRSSEGVWRLEFSPPVPLDLPEEEILKRFLQSGRFAECNTAHARNKGLSTPEEVVGKSLREILPFLDSDRERMESFRSAIRGKFQNRSVAFRGLDRGGNVRHFIRSEVPIVENGVLLRIWGITRDVTQLRETEQELADSEARYRRLVDNAAVGIYRTTPDGRILMANPALIRMLGYSDFQSLAARNLEDDSFEPRYSRRDFRERMEKEAQVIGMEEAWTKHDGAVIWVRESARAVRDEVGNILCYEGIVENITERKRADLALQESETRFRTLIEKAPLAIAIGRGGVNVYANQKCREMFGYDIMGRPICEQWTPASWGMIEERSRQQGDGFAVTDSYEAVGRRQNGDRFSAQIDVRIVNLPDGPATLAFLTDITERERAQQELKSSLAQVRALAARLQSVREEESRRLARELHDQLGQALTALRLDVNSMIAEGPANAQLWATKSSSILNLVDETLQTVRRISRELRPGMLDDLGLVPTLEWAVEEFRSRTRTECVLDLPQEDIPIAAERGTAIYRILQEILTNVARHAAANRVEVQLTRRDHDIILLVHDNGSGIPADKLARRDSLGILGMQERALAVGGEIRICSSPGAGTTVRARIPAA